MGGLYVFLQQACGKGRKELPGICQFGKKRNGGILFDSLEQRSGTSAETKGTGIGGKMCIRDRVSMGHSSATYEQAMLGIANGATSMTHVYNGMTPYHHRKPGLVGAAFRVRDIYGEIICDGCHSHLAALNNYFQAKGRDYGIMVSDSLRAKHCPPGGSYQLGGHDIEIGEDGLARLKGTDTIAGSTLNMNKGLKILVEKALVPLDAAINSCTLNPARCLGVDDRKGKLVVGYDADIVVLEDNYDVVQTYCRGKKML